MGSMIPEFLKRENVNIKYNEIYCIKTNTTTEELLCIDYDEDVDY